MQLTLLPYVRFILMANDPKYLLGCKDVKYFYVLQSIFVVVSVAKLNSNQINSVHIMDPEKCTGSPVINR